MGGVGGNGHDAEDPLKDRIPPPVLTGTSGNSPTSVAVLHERGKVILKFPEPKLWVAFDPNGARNVGDAMNAEADFIERRITRKERLEGAAERLRDRLITRVTLMLTSMERDGKKPAYQAGAIVDQVLSTVQELASR